MNTNKFCIPDGYKVIISIITFVLGCTLYGVSLDTGINTLGGLSVGLVVSGVVYSIITTIHYYDKED